MMNLLWQSLPVLLILLQCQKIASQSQSVELCGSYTNWGSICSSRGPQDFKKCGSVHRLRMCTNNDACWQDYEFKNCSGEAAGIWGEKNETWCYRRQQMKQALLDKTPSSFHQISCSCSDCSVPLYPTSKAAGLDYVGPAVQDTEVIIRGTVCQTVTDWDSRCYSRRVIPEADRGCGSLAKWEYCQNATDCWRNYQLTPCFKKVTFFGKSWSLCSSNRRDTDISAPIVNVTQFCTECVRNDICKHRD